MKIAIIAHSKFPIAEPYAGGLEMITHLLVDTLVERGHVVHLYAHENSQTKAKLFPIKSFTTTLKNYMGKEELETVNNANYWDTLSYSNVFAQINEREYDIIHNHSLSLEAIILGNAISQNFITSLHTPPFINLKVAALSIKGYNNQFFTGVSKSLCNQWKGLIDDCTTIYNGIDISKWRYKGKQGKKSYVFWYGRICKEKAPELALEAAHKAGKEIRLAGPLNDQDRPYFEEKIQPFLKLENATYLGHLSQKEINEHLNNCESYIFTSIWDEPYGLVLPEALATGTPIIAFDTGACREILTEKTAIIVPTGDIEATVQAINKARFIQSKDCRTRAEEFCSHQGMVDQYEHLYKHIINTNQLKHNIYDRVLRP